MKKSIIIVAILCIVAIPIIYLNISSTTTVGEEMKKLQTEYGDIQSLSITQHTPPQGIAETRRSVTLEDPNQIEQLLSQAAPTELTPTDTPPPAYYYSIGTVTSEARFQIFLYDGGFSIDGSDHFLIEGKNLFIEAIEDASFDWVEDER